MSNKLRQRYQNYYLSLVKRFLSENKNIKADGIPELHLPFWGINYRNANPKIVFIGKETKRWGSMNKFLLSAESNALISLQRHEKEF